MYKKLQYKMTAKSSYKFSQDFIYKNSEVCNFIDAETKTHKMTLTKLCEAAGM